jgi:hypothetical protein
LYSDFVALGRLATWFATALSFLKDEIGLILTTSLALVRRLRVTVRGFLEGDDSSTIVVKLTAEGPGVAPIVVFTWTTDVQNKKKKVSELSDIGVIRWVLTPSFRKPQKNR